MTIPVLHIPTWSPDPKNVFEELLDYPWKQEIIKQPFTGKLIPEARKVIWYANNGKDYVYSGKRNSATPMTELLSDLAEYAEDAIYKKLQRRVKFNSVFCNLYEDGKKYINWHRDDEAGLASDIIASVSYGATRDFKVRRDSDKKVETFTLNSGDLLVMHSNCQKDYTHSVPKRLRVKEPRINLTFRVFE